MSLTTPFSDAAKNNSVPNIFMDLVSAGFKFETIHADNDDGKRNIFRAVVTPDQIPLIDINGRMDLAFIADAYARHAVFKDPHQVETLTEAVQKIGAALTWVENMGNGWSTNNVLSNMIPALQNIKKIATLIGAKEVSLPFSAERCFTAESKLGQALMSELSYGTGQVSFREEPYNVDMSALGSLDPERKSSYLFNGEKLHSFVPYDDAFCYFWQNDLEGGMGKNGQTSFDFIKEKRPLEFYLH